MALFDRSSTSEDEDTWTFRDAALWHTIDAVHAALEGDLTRLQRVPVPFALQSGRSAERTVASAPFRLWSWQSLGDGSYYHDQSVYFASGRGALGFTLGAMAGRAVGNSRRSRQAAQDAQPRWVPIEQGQLTVSDFGFYLHTAQSVLWWNWESITLAQLTAPGTVQIHGNSLTGPVNWQLVSDVAELVLCYWALVRSRHHPQLLSGTWIPVDWVQKTVRTWGDIHPVHEIVLRRLND